MASSSSLGSDTPSAGVLSVSQLDWTRDRKISSVVKIRAQLDAVRENIVDARRQKRRMTRKCASYIYGSRNPQLSRNTQSEVSFSFVFAQKRRKARSFRLLVLRDSTLRLFTSDIDLPTARNVFINETLQLETYDEPNCLHKRSHLLLRHSST